MKFFSATFWDMIGAFRNVRWLFRFDLASGILVAVFVIVFVPTLANHAQDAVMLRVHYDDDALITMQLDGMTTQPFGNPANYLEEGLPPDALPAHWHNINFRGLPYYGGLYLDMALAIWAPLKLVGFDLFPTAVVVLRVLALLFSALTILAAYNFARTYFGAITAVLASFMLATDGWFVYIGPRAHPDSLLFFLCIVFLGLSVQHVCDGRFGSVAAMGVVAGLAQGAKMGGPLLVPLAILSMVVALASRRKGLAWKRWLQLLILQGLLMAGVAIFVFFLTTPYAFLGSYFLKTWLAFAKIFAGDSPISPTTFFAWWQSFQVFNGIPLLVLAAAGVSYLVVWEARFASQIAGAFTLVLGLTIFLYYALFQHFWVQEQYVVISHWSVACFAAYLIDRILARIKPFSRVVSSSGVTLGIVVTLSVLLSSRVSDALLPLIYDMWWTVAPQMAIGKRAEEHLRDDASVRILSDAPIYFDPAKYPNLRVLANPIRYRDLALELPDYFILTRYPYNYNWQSAKIGGAQLEPWDADTFNMRLYQDLLGRDPKKVTVNNAVPFASLVTSTGFNEQGGNPAFPVHIVLRALSSVPFLSNVIARSGAGIGHSRYEGLFKLDRAKFIAMMPPEYLSLTAQPFASSATADSTLKLVATGAGHWRSQRTGNEVVGEFVGIKLYAGIHPNSVAIRWVAWSWCPETFDVEYSDDEQQWRTAGSFRVATPDNIEIRNTGAARWSETYQFGDVGAHRSWRVKATAIPQGNLFGLEQIKLQ